MQIGEVIRENRKRKKLTQEEMAKRLGVTASDVNKWENGNSHHILCYWHLLLDCLILR